jgi:hypothetical protein
MEPNLSVSARDLVKQPEPLEVPMPQPDRSFLDTSVAPALDQLNRTIEDRERTLTSERDDTNRQLQRTLDNAPSFDDNLDRNLERMGSPDAFSELRGLREELVEFDTETQSQRQQVARGNSAAGAALDGNQLARQRAVQSSGLQARAALLQGNIQQATALAERATDDAFRERSERLNVQMSQLQSIESQLGANQQRQFQTQMQEVAAQQEELQRIKANVSAAIATGQASREEMAQFSDPNLGDDQKLVLAEQIQGRAAERQRIMQETLVKEQIASARRANRPQPKAAKLRPTSVIEQDGKKLLIDTQTGEVVAEFGADTDTSELQTVVDKQFIDTIDALKTDDGLSKAVGANPLARWTPFKADVLDGDVSDFTASVDQLTKGLTLNQLVSAKEQGATFGALAIPEMELLAESATKINNWRKVETDEQGNANTLYYDASEKDFIAELDKISNFRKLDAVLNGAEPASVGVMVQEDGTMWSQNGDGSYTQLR